MLLEPAQGLSDELKDEEKLARKYYDFLTNSDSDELPDFEWDETTGKLWTDIEATWRGVKELMKGVTLLDERLDGLKGIIKAG